ncbi:MAG: hypothetical protein ACKO2F_02405 [Cyanobacteriota bacterium]
MAEQERLDRGERSEGGRREGRRGGSGGGGADRDGVGLRIRLSDNELRAARTIQDAFQLRSTVAVMGFCLRTMAQLLEQGALEGVTYQPRGGRSGERGERGERRGGGAPAGRGPRPDPFARPSRPAAPVAAEPELTEEGEVVELSTEVSAEVSSEVTSEVIADTEVGEASEGQDQPTAEAASVEAEAAAEAEPAVEESAEA